MLCVIQYTCTRIYRDKCGEIKTALLEEGTLGLLHFFFQLLHKPKTFHNKNLEKRCTGSRVRLYEGLLASHMVRMVTTHRRLHLLSGPSHLILKADNEQLLLHPQSHPSQCAHAGWPVRSFPSITSRVTKRTRLTRTWRTCGSHSAPSTV